jgi:hypothetical protein
MRTFEVDVRAGVEPLTVTARLFTTEWKTWRWLLNGSIHQPIDGVEHTFVLPAGTHTISVRGVKTDGTVEQDEAATVLVARTTTVNMAIEVSAVTGPAPLALTARLLTEDFVQWRWLLDGLVHQPGASDREHGYVLDQPGTYRIGLRGQGVDGTVVQPPDTGLEVVVTVLPQDVTVPPPPPPEPPAEPAEAFWRICTSAPICEFEATGITTRKWRGIRVEGTNYDDVLAQCQQYGWRPLWILHRGEEHTVPGGIEVEVGNECNAGCEGDPPWPKLTPAEYVAWVKEVWGVLEAKGNTVYVGAINNTSPGALAWLREVLAALPRHPRLRVSLHRYADADQDVTTPKKGHRSIEEEDRAIVSCVNGRGFGISEAGLIDATYRDWSSWKFFGKKRVRRAFDGHRWQAERFRKLGADFYVVYQMHDGNGPGWINNLGILRFDGVTWKDTANLPL